MHTGGSVYTQIMCRQYFSDKSVSCNLYEIAARPIGGFFFVGGGQPATSAPQCIEYTTVPNVTLLSTDYPVAVVGQL